MQEKIHMLSNDFPLCNRYSTNFVLVDGLFSYSFICHVSFILPIYSRTLYTNIVIQYKDKKYCYTTHVICRKKMCILSNDSQLCNKQATKYPIFCQHFRIYDSL